MTTRQMTAIAFKIIAIYVFYSTAIAFPFFLFFTWDHINNKWLGVLGIVVAACAGGAAAWFAWRFAASLAKDVRDTESESIVAKFSKEQFEQVLFRFFGLYVFVAHLNSAINNFLKLIYIFPRIADIQTRVTFVVDLAVLCVAASFFLKPRFWQKRFSALDTKGCKAGSDEAPDMTSVPALDSNSSAHQN